MQTTSPDPIFASQLRLPEDLAPPALAALDREIARLELAFSLARERLLPFERTYGASSKHFVEHVAAEDLQGGNDEYVQWAGECRLMQRLQEKL